MKKKTVLEAPAEETKSADTAKGRKTASKKPAAKKTAAKPTAAKKAAGKDIEKAAPVKKAPAKAAAKKTVKKAVNTNVDDSYQSTAEIKAGVSTYAAEAAAGVKVMEGIEDLAKEQDAKKAAAAKPAPAKKAAAKKTAAKPAKAAAKSADAKPAADVDGSYQSEAEIKAGVSKYATEAADGVKVMEGIEALAKEKAAKPAAKKARAASKASKNDSIEGSHQTAAEVKAGVDVYADEAADGVKVMEGIEKIAEETAEKEEATDEMASRKNLAAKAAAHTYGQINLSARSKADGAAAAKGFKKPARKKAAKKAAKPVQAKPVEIVIIAEELEKAANASRTGLAKKAAAKAAVQNALSAESNKAYRAYLLEQSHQTEAEMMAEEKMVGDLAKAGVTYIEGAEAVTDTPYADEVKESDASKASLANLAAKAAAHTYGQVNLSARSQADAKAAAKAFKKPARKKAAKTAKNDAKAAQDALAAQYSGQERLQKLIAKEDGRPYEEVIAEVEEKAAQASRKALAARTKTVMGAEKVNDNSSVTADQKAFYDTLDDQTLMDMMSSVGLDMDLDTLMAELTKAESIDDAIDSYVEEAKESGKTYSFEKDGFGLSVIPYLCKRLEARIPNKAESNRELAKKITKDIDRMLINDGANDSAIYKDLFDDVRQVLVYAQQNEIESLDEMEKIIPADLHKLLDRFMTVAYTILPGWQYNDVKYYEGFLYSVMAQFDDLAPWQNRALMDIADLYIRHGDYTRGNDGYSYVLRENQLKDQIYFRFASVYVPIDLQRAKGIVHDALRIIDGRYDYYPRLIEILNK